MKNCRKGVLLTGPKWRTLPTMQRADEDERDNISRTAKLTKESDPETSTCSRRN